jgi:hypothetical protein
VHRPQKRHEFAKTRLGPALASGPVGGFALKHKLSLIMLSPVLLLVTAACSSDDGATRATDEDYDDVAQSLGAVVATGNGGGEVGSLSDSTDLAVGLPPAGITLSASGQFKGNRVGITYDYKLTCDDAGGQKLDACGANTSSAEVEVDWSGNLAVPNFSAAVARHGKWTLSKIQTGTTEFAGHGDFTFDAQLQPAGRNIQREYHFSYAADYDGVLVQRFPRLVVGGEVHYTIDAVRKGASSNGDSSATFHVSADLKFGSDGSAVLTLDGSHHYTVNTASGQVIKG